MILFGVGTHSADSTRRSPAATLVTMRETLNMIDTVEGRIAAAKLAAKTDRSAAEDLDLVQAISDFQTRQTGYDAALKTYSTGAAPVAVPVPAGLIP